jgi:hypothetical protein
LVLSHIENTLTLRHILRYSREVYGARLYCKNQVTYVNTCDDTYKLEYDSESGKFYFISTSNHFLLCERYFERGLFKVASKRIYDEIGLKPTVEDWREFFNDAYKYESRPEESNE